jgi:3-oxoacyl-[acyl-carrier-protein] synthase-3
MTFTNVLIKGVGIYHPPHAYDNEFFIEHFRKQGKEVAGLMKSLGRKVSYRANLEEDNMMTMGIKAGERALADAGVMPEEIDMIVFVSETPEYSVPTTACTIHKHLGLKNCHIQFDMNMNCTGMITALDQVATYLKGNKRVRKALVVGGLLNSIMAQKSCTIAYANIADGAAAIVLEKTEGDVQLGVLDSQYYTDSSKYERMLYPQVGLSRIHDEGRTVEEKQFMWIPHEVDFFVELWRNMILDITERNGVRVEDVDHFLFSQFSKHEVEETLHVLGVPLDKYTFCAEEYGYMGCASPFFALYEAKKRGVVKEGSLVIFISVGGGFSMSSVLYQF